jgi:hypothetical protein
MTRPARLSLIVPVKTNAGTPAEQEVSDRLSGLTEVVADNAGDPGDGVGPGAVSRA